MNKINKIIHYRKYAYCNSGLAYQFVEYISNSKDKSSLTLAKIDFATDLLLIFTSLGKRISITFSIIFALLSITSIIYTIVAYMTLNVVSGWTTMMLLLSVSFTGIFLCFGIVIKYLNLLLINQQSEENLIASKRRI